MPPQTVIITFFLKDGTREIHTVPPEEDSSFILRNSVMDKIYDIRDGKQIVEVHIAIV